MDTIDESRTDTIDGSGTNSIDGSGTNSIDGSGTDAINVSGATTIHGKETMDTDTVDDHAADKVHHEFVIVSPESGLETAVSPLSFKAKHFNTREGELEELALRHERKETHEEMERKKIEELFRLKCIENEMLEDQIKKTGTIIEKLQNNVRRKKEIIDTEALKMEVLEKREKEKDERREQEATSNGERLSEYEEFVKTLKVELEEKDEELKVAKENITELIAVSRKLKGVVVERDEENKVLVKEKEALREDVDILNESISQIRGEIVKERNIQRSATELHLDLNALTQDVADFKKYVFHQLGEVNEKVNNNMHKNHPKQQQQ